MVDASLVSLDDFKKLYFESYQKLFISEFGFFFDEGRAAQLRTVLLKHIQKSKFTAFDTYFDYLKNHYEGKLEIKKIINDITIGETYFFRNLPQLDILRSEIIPKIVNRKRILGVNDIKIWSAGCSSGEEVYTLAMMLMEEVPGAPLWNISVLGTDINKNFLEIAKKGLYTSKRTFKHLPPGLLDKYFVRYGKSYVLNDQIKKITRFEQQNLIKDDFNLPEMIDLDIIFCRNVTIYFNIDTTKHLINKIYDVLGDQSYLFIGHSETLWQISNKFVTLDFPHAFVYQKDLTHQSTGKDEAPYMTIPELNLENISISKKMSLGTIASDTKKSEVMDTQFNAPNEKEPSSGEDTFGISELPAKSPDDFYSLQIIDKKYHHATMDFEKKNYEDALHKFGEIIEKDETYILAYFGRATIYANQGKYDDGINELNKITNFDNLFLEAYYLLGVLYDKKQDIDTAISMFEKVVYIDHSVALAYYHLGNLYRYKGNHQRASLQFKNIKNLLTNNNEEEEVKFSEGMTNKNLLQLIDKLLMT